MNPTIRQRDFTAEFIFRTSRSSGSGGQNVNKVSTRVELIFHVESSRLLSADEKKMIAKNLGSRIRKDGAIHLICQEARTQPANKKKVIERFYTLLEKALTPVKKRIPVSISEHEKEKRLEEKKRQARKKELRRKGTEGNGQ